MNWNDELCGVKVTPLAWAQDGGVISTRYGRWARVSHRSTEDRKRADRAFHWRINFCGDAPEHCPWTMLRRDEFPWDGTYLPIFPPRGWAGKTDADLWAAVFGGRGLNVGVGVTMFYEDSDPRIAWSNGLWSPLAYPGFPPSALILALQNAQVLARRLA